jgi:hypothetical protein
MNNPAAGLIPFHRRYFSPTNLVTRAAEDRNLGLYVQDTWRPHARLTINGGVRFDYVKRQDNLFNIVREDAWHVGPRIGFSYMLTGDAKNIIRGSYVRVHEQMMGRDAVTTFGAGGAAEQRNTFDVDGDGVFETERIAPARNASLAPFEFDDDVHQPHVDEFIIGIRKQFPGQWSTDVAFMKRSYQEMYAQLEINGFWPEGPNQPFGGFGRVDPNRGLVYQQTNNTWSTLEYKAIEATVAKNLSNNFQALISINRQWQQFGGTWNPTDPARFIQPDHFPSNRLLYMPRGNNEHNSLPINTGTTVHTYGPTWQDYSLRFGGTYRAPWNVNLSASYTILAGPWSGPVVDLVPANDPSLDAFGPATFRLANGTSQNNPLRTRMRFTGTNRGDAQVKAPDVKTLGVQFNKVFRFGRQGVEIGGSIFNLLNSGDYTQYNYSGANEQFNPNFLLMRNQQAARAFQATLVYRF